MIWPRQRLHTCTQACTRTDTGFRVTSISFANIDSLTQAAFIWLQGNRMGIFAAIKMLEFQRFGKASQPTCESAEHTLVLFWHLIKVTPAISQHCLSHKSARIFIPDPSSPSGLLLFVCLFFLPARRILPETTGGGAARPGGHWLHTHSGERHS